MLLLGTLIALRRAAAETQLVPAGAASVRPAAALAVALLFATIVAGGYMAGTEREGAEGAPIEGGAHLACGTEFPTCLGELWPFGTGEMVDVHLTHRGLSYLAALAVLAAVALARRRGVSSRAFPLAAGLLLVQILLGALNVWLGEHPELVVAHLTLGTLLWGTVVHAAMQLVPVPDPVPSRLRRAEAEASVSPA
jgi:heme A synthase